MTDSTANNFQTLDSEMVQPAVPAVPPAGEMDRLLRVSCPSLHFMLSRLISPSSVFALVAFLITQGVGRACGLEWTLPVNHFDGVNEWGYVSYWEKVGDLDLGNGLVLPLTINFCSSRDGWNSPYVGQGWMLPLLDSNFVQVDERTFRMVEPDGRIRMFWRGNSNDTILGSAGGWRAEIKGNEIDAYASCGWKVSYLKGHIVGLLTPRNRQLDFSYSGNTVIAIREKGATKLSIERDVATGHVNALVFSGKRIEITLDQKPRIENIAGQNVVAGMAESLKSIAPSTGPTKSFEFAVNNKVQPTLKITSNGGHERLFTWDPATERIVGDDGWEYEIKHPNGTDNPAEISRFAPTTKQKEYWFFDGTHGCETTIGSDNVRNVRTWFLSGIAAGKPRKLAASTKGFGEKIVSRFAYDEQGRIIRAELPSGLNLQYADGLLLSGSEGGSRVLTCTRQ
jgi:hypothetical protein